MNYTPYFCLLNTKAFFFVFSWLQHRYTKDKLDDDDDVFEDLVVARGKRIIKRIVLLVVWVCS